MYLTGKHLLIPDEAHSLTSATLRMLCKQKAYRDFSRYFFFCRFHCYRNYCKWKFEFIPFLNSSPSFWIAARHISVVIVTMLVVVSFVLHILMVN